MPSAIPVRGVGLTAERDSTGETLQGHMNNAPIHENNPEKQWKIRSFVVRVSCSYMYCAVNVKK